ncbi:MAG: hypothetical protein LLG97_14990 [Deltaproteobacteria bacterium]|nr:hypothetical protein [Deltaproteobacteria bacterium]
MWVFTKQSFVCILALENSPADYMIQSRFPGHIEALFPDAEVTEAPYGIYRYRAAVQKHIVVKTLLNNVEHIDYFHFKDAIPDKRYQAALRDVWDTLNKHDVGPGKPHDPEAFMP